MVKVAGMHKGKLVIYTLFTDTQFTTKTKQINISLTSVGGPSLGSAHTCGAAAKLYVYYISAVRSKNKQTNTNLQ